MGNENHERRQNKRNIELCNLIKQGDREASNHLLKENEGLIISIIEKIESGFDSNDIMIFGIEREDMVQEGRIAMLNAARGFNENSGVLFSTYAYTVVKNALLDYCSDELAMYEKRKLFDGYSRIFLDANPLDKDGFPLSETVPSTDVQFPTMDQAVLQVMIEKMRNRLQLLPDRQRIFIAYLYGIDMPDWVTIEEAAEFFHLSVRHAKEIERSALRTLRQGMNDGKLV